MVLHVDSDCGYRAIVCNENTARTAYEDRMGEFLNNLRTSLKPGATLVVVHWDSEKMSVEIEMSPSDLDLYSKEGRPLLDGA